MSGLRTLLYGVCFAGLAATAAVVTARIADPPVTSLLLLTVMVATFAGAPGLVRRRAWPVAILLLPLGAYLLARGLVPVPPETEGAGANLAFYADQLQAGAVAYARDVFPLNVSGQDHLRLLLALVVYTAVGAAAFLGLSLRRPLPAIVILLVLAGFGFTTDESARDPWPALAFVLLAGGMLAVSRSLRRERTGATDALAGGVTAVAAALLALSILGTTTVEAGRPLRDWRQWDILGSGIARFRFDLMQNYPRLLDPAEDEVVMRVRSAVPSYWRASILDTFSGISWRGDLPEGRQLEPDLSDGDWVYDVPPAEPAPQGRLVTQRFEIVRAYTDRLFSGGWPDEVSVRMPLVLRMMGATAIAVAPPRGPELEYTVKAVVPDLGPADLIGRGRYYPDAGGHVIVEDYPGVGKTLLAKALARSVGGRFSRIQFTPDLLPSDVTGVNVFDQQTTRFEFHPGPVFANVVLADEINRASPKTQSSLLECMEEGQATIDNVAHRIVLPFMIIATQNPIEYEGTYPLPEAQLDRFMMRLSLGYPSAEAEEAILESQTSGDPYALLEPVVEAADVLAMQEAVTRVRVAPALRRYVVDVVAATRDSRDVYLGASPRAGIALLRAAKAQAVLRGRDYVVPQDVKDLAPRVLGHRIILSPEAGAHAHGEKAVIARILDAVPIPGPGR